MADTTVTVTEDVTNVTVEADTAITITEDVTEVDITATTPVSITSAGGISFNAYGGISSTNVQSALQELADQFTITTSQPGSPEEGDLFYDEVIEHYIIESAEKTNNINSPEKSLSYNHKSNTIYFRTFDRD